MLYNEEIELDEDFEGVDDSEAEVVTEFDEVDENTDYDNNYTYVDIDFQQDTPQLIDTPTPVVDPVVEETELIPDPEFETVTETYEMRIQDYSQEYLQALEDDGYTFYVIYEDGTEDEVDISEIEEPTTSIEFLDDEAYVLANSILEHFWDDDSGVHVTQDTKESWTQLVEDNFPDLDATHPHHNIIVNSYGVLIRSALKNLVQLSRSALAFYDGLGNNSSNIISTFGRGGIQIGPTDQKHLVINNNGITVYNGDGTVAPLTASNIQAIEANIQTLTATDAAITGRLTAAEGNITTLTSSKADVTDLTAATARITSLEGDHVTVSDFQAEQAKISALQADHVSVSDFEAEQANIDNLQAATADIATIRANSAKVANLTAQQLEADHATVGSLSTNYAHISNGVIDNAKIDQADVNNLSTNYAHIANGIIDNATIDKAKVNGLSATYATIANLNTANARITDLEADHVSVDDFEADHAVIESLDSNYAHITNGVIDNAKIGHADVNGLSANYAHVSNGVIDNAKIDQANVNNLSANYAHIENGVIDNAKIGYADVNGLSANYAQVNMANVNNAWIQNGTVKDGAITNAMINSVSANKLTAGTIDASDITVTNLNADNITTGTINGQRIGTGSLSLDKLEEDVYTETEVDGIVQNLQTQIDGAIETWTGTTIPTLQNAPAVNWNTNSIKDTHVGDVYFVVNSQSDQNGYNYRFTKTGNTYSWQLIKDNDVTNALQRLTTAEGKIGTIETFDSTVSSFMTNTDQELTSIKSAATTLAGRVTTAEGTLATKVDTTTFNSLSQTVDGHSSSITQLTTETTTLTQAVDTLNTKTSSDSGNIIQFDNSIGFKEIVVHGKSTQASYTGKNLLELHNESNGSRTAWTYTTLTNEEVTGTYSGSVSVFLCAYKAVLKAGTYTFSAETITNLVQVYVYTDAVPGNNRVAYGSIVNNKMTFTVSNDGTYYIGLYRAGSSSAGAISSVIRPQLELGSTATDYEPYVGGKPAPNPDYPQEIKSVDDLTLNVCGKNLFDADNATFANGYYYDNRYNGAHFSSTYARMLATYTLIVGEATYTLSYSKDDTNQISCGIMFYDEDKVYISGTTFAIDSPIGKKSVTFTTPDNARYIRFHLSLNSSNIQLELGTVATDYEPYQGQSIDIPLGDHQIRSLPDGTDDTLTFSYIGPSIREGWGLYNAELVQRVEHVVLDGSGTENYYIDTAGTYNRNVIITKNGWINAGHPDVVNRVYSAMCDKLEAKNKTYTTWTTPGISGWVDNTASLILAFPNDVAFSDQVTFKTWLASNPLTIDYALATFVTHNLGIVELPLSEDLNLWVSTSPSTAINATWWHEPGRAEKNAIDISLTSSNLGDAIDSTTLPAPYTEVEWVESNGAQYVYLDWKPPIETWGFEADFIIRNAFTTSVGAWNPNTNANGFGNVFGTRNTSMTNDIQLGTYYTNGVVRWGQDGYALAGLFKTDKTRQQVSLRGTTLTKADGTTVTITRSTEVDSKFYANMAVFCMHEGLRRGGTGGIVQPGSVRIYSLKFYDGDELKVDLVGAIRNRDGITGLYDKVKDHFYPAYGMTYGDIVGDLGIPDTILEAVAKSKINVHIDNRQISRMWRAEVPELNKLEDGQTISVTFSTNIGATTPVAAGLVGWDETATTAYVNVFLKLALADETETDWIPCFYAQGTRLTSHYGSGTPILLTYRENVLYGASTTHAGTSVMRAWYADPNYVDGNTQYTKYSDSVIAGLNGIKRYTLCMKDQNGKWTSIINQANTVAATKTCYTGGLQLDTILYYSPANEIAAGNASSNGLWESFGIIDWRYSFNVENNATNGLTYRTPLYLVGTLSDSDGLFYLDTTKWWTQVPNDPTKIYIWVSAGYPNWYQGILSVQNTVYAYDEDAGLIEINVSRYSKTTTKLNQTIDTVDEHTQKIGVLETTVENKADSSDLTTVSNTLNTVSQTATSNSQKITNLTTRLGTNADGTAGVNDIVAKESALEQDLDGFKTTVSSTYSTKTELSAVQDDISDLQEGSKLSSTETGAVVTIDDALSAPPIDIVVYGKSTQASYTGKNLFDINGVSFGTNAADTTKTDTGVTVTANLASGWSYGAVTIEVSNVSSVTLSTVPSKSTPRIALEGRYSDDTVGVTQSALASSISVTLPSGVTKVRCIFYSRQTASGAVGDTCTYNNIQLELGSTATSYEPYVGGKPAPNPEYPQSIESVDDLTLNVCGKNLFHINDATVGGVTFTNTETGVTLTGTTTNSWVMDNYYINASRLVGETMTLSASFTKDNVGYVNIQFFKKDGVRITEYTVGREYGSLTPKTFVVPENTSRIRFSVGVKTANVATGLTISPQLELGSTASDYEPYVGASASIPLSNHSLRSLPDGTKDELDLAYLRPSTRTGWAWYSKTLVQKIDKLALNGILPNGTAYTDYTFTVSQSTGSPDYTYAYSGMFTNIAKIGYSDKLTVLNGSGGAGSVVTSDSIGNGTEAYRIRLFLLTSRLGINWDTDTSGISRARKLNTWLTNNPIVVYFVLATPQTIDLGEVELPVMPSEHATIWSDAGSVQSDISINYWLNNAADIVPHLLDIDAVSKNDIKTIETRVSTAESTIEQHSASIELKANSSDVYTKEQSDGLISTEVTNRNAAITAATDAITLSVSETYATKKETAALEAGSSNLITNLEGHWQTGALTNSVYSFQSGYGRIVPTSSENTGTVWTIEPGTHYIFRAQNKFDSTTKLYVGIHEQNSSGTHLKDSGWQICTGDGYQFKTLDNTATIKLVIRSGDPDGVVTTSKLIEHISNGLLIFTFSKDLETRISEAEASISVNANNIALKVSKDGVISSINQSAESVKIQASKVEIDGTAIFTNSDFQTQLNNQGYATTGQVATAKSEAISAAASDATSKANAAQSAAISAAVSDATSKANAAQSAAEATAAADATSKANAVNSSLESYKTATNATLTSLQNQVDGQIEAWYKSVDPTTSNEPASTWNTDALKARHEGDIYYNVENGHSWRWMKSGSTYSWQRIPDSDAAAALAVAQNAQTLAGSKRRIFTTTPTVPYDVGDLWVNGTSIRYASTSKADGQTYSESDWTVTATDDTLAQSAVDVTHRIYYRTQTANSSLAAPTTWVEEATGNVYNQWTTKVPPLAANTATGQTKYLYLYTCEQRKRLDGTVLCTKVLLDENTTVIDGGQIITNSVTANQIAVGAITAEKLDATNINASNSLTIGALSTSTQSSILNSELSADIASAAKRTDVSIAVTAIDYAVGTATLQASLYIDGVVTTSGVTYQWLKDGTNISGQTSRTLSVTSAMGLSHVYSCTATY